MLEQLQPGVLALADQCLSWDVDVADVLELMPEVEADETYSFEDAFSVDVAGCGGCEETLDAIEMMRAVLKDGEALETKCEIAK